MQRCFFRKSAVVGRPDLPICQVSRDTPSGFGGRPSSPGHTLWSGAVEEVPENVHGDPAVIDIRDPCGPRVAG
jgi:hypothetical protein